MAGVLEIACLLGGEQEAGAATALLARLAYLLDGEGASDGQESAADELDAVIFDLQPALLRCAALSPAAERQVRRVLVAAAERCTAREVFMLGMAALGEQLRCGGSTRLLGVAHVGCRSLAATHSAACPTSTHPASLLPHRSCHDADEPPATYGPASPDFQLFLLGTLQRCLPRIHRRPLHFAAELLNMQLRWAADVLPGLPLGDALAAAIPASDGSGAVGAATGSGEDEQREAAATVPTAATAAGAVARLAGLAADMAAWLGQQRQQIGAVGQAQLTADERQAATALLGMTLLQLAGLALQLPQALQAAEAAVRATGQAQPSGGSSSAAPTAGGRLPAMHAAAEQLLLLPRALLRQVPAAVCGGGTSGDGGGGGCPAAAALQQLAETAIGQLTSKGLDLEDLSYFSSAEAAEGAAAAACAEALEPATPAQQHAVALQQVLPQAARQLLDVGTQHQSVALSLLPLAALCSACGAVAGSAAAGGVAGAAAGDGSSASDRRLAASSPALAALLSALVAIMSHNPVQLVRSCAHDALHALLDALAPAARLEQLRALMQVGCCSCHGCTGNWHGSGCFDFA